LDPFLYQYAIGGTVFAIGLIYAGRSGYLGLRGRGLRNLLVALGGLAACAALQGWLQYGEMTVAEPVPFSGATPTTPTTIGTGLDYAVMGAYFLAILAIGTWFGRGQRSTRDFFFGGQRFSWWLIAFSLLATTIGSYSFVKYSKVAYSFGLASSQTYLNDWFWMPLFLFGWLPILYFSRLTSIPEYFERRFGRPARRLATALLLLYLVGYVGVNLFTMGKALHYLLGWPVLAAAAGVAAISATYVTAGGQTSVIMTDLFQGVMLLVVGLGLLVLGALALGGFEPLWEHLPRSHRSAFASFNEDPSYNSVGIFWQDAMANSAMFYFLNQGILMRFMAARSVEEGRKAATAVLLVLMPVAAVVVASGGWVGRSLEHAGLLPPGMDPAKVFFITADFLARPGVFGLVMAALTAALMSTVDTLITAVSAIVVNDVIQPLRPAATESQLLKAARWTALAVTVVGVGLVPIFSMFDSIYAAHGAFTAAVTPPLVVALLLGVFWKRFTAAAALATMGGGALAILASILYPALVAPFAQGVPAVEIGDGLLEGARQYKYMRACYGLCVSAAIGIAVTLVTRPDKTRDLNGLVWGTVAAALARYKGRAGTEQESAWTTVTVRRRAQPVEHTDSGLPRLRVSAALASALAATTGDLLYISDRRRFLGGLRSGHVLIDAIQTAGSPTEGPWIELDDETAASVVAPGREDLLLRARRLY
jgi:SSS family solute:Na+ symporter